MENLNENDRKRIPNLKDIHVKEFLLVIKWNYVGLD